MMALPVKDLNAAFAFYQVVLGFSVVSRDSSGAVLARDEVRLGLVDELETMRRELEQSGGNPGEFGMDEWDGVATPHLLFARRR